MITAIVVLALLAGSGWALAIALIVGRGIAIADQSRTVDIAPGLPLGLPIDDELGRPVGYVQLPEPISPAAALELAGARLTYRTWMETETKRKTGRRRR